MSGNRNICWVHLIHALGYFESVLWLIITDYECWGRWILEITTIKVDILREWSMTANVTTLKFTCKTNYCCERWVYNSPIYFLFFWHCWPCHNAAAFSKLCADKPPFKCITNFIWSFMGSSNWFKRVGNMNNIEISGIHRHWTQVFRCLLSCDLSLLTINLCFTFDQLFLSGMQVCLGAQITTCRCVSW
jgi:hypothetical protein